MNDVTFIVEVYGSQRLAIRLLVNVKQVAVFTVKGLRSFAVGWLAVTRQPADPDGARASQVPSKKLNAFHGSSAVAESAGSLCIRLSANNAAAVTKLLIVVSFHPEIEGSVPNSPFIRSAT